MWLPRCALLVLLAVAAAEPQFQQNYPAKPQPQPWGGRSRQTKDENPIIFEDALARAREQARSTSTTSQAEYPAYQQTNTQGQGETGNEEANILTKNQQDYPQSNTQTQNNGQGYQLTNTQNGQGYYPSNTHTQSSGQEYQPTNVQTDPSYYAQNPLTAKRPTRPPVNIQKGQAYQPQNPQADPYNPQNSFTARPTHPPANTQNGQAYPPTNTQNGQSYQPSNPQVDPYNPQNSFAARPTHPPANTQNVQSYPQTNTQFQRQPSFNQQTNYTKQISTEDQYEEERGEVKKYDRCQVWNIIINDDQSKLHVVGGLTRVQELTSWGGNHTAVDFLVKPENQMHVGAILRRSNIKYSVVIDDLQKNIDAENPPLSEEDQELQDRKGHRMTWQQYHRLADIHGYLDYLAITYPSICSVRSIGKSHEGRELKMLRISNGRANNKAVLIDGGIHAREWISPATVTYIINEFVENFDDESDTVRNMDWYIVPVLNPDGYEYTHSIDRLWRKNRRRFGVCSGVDLNRNFGYKWGGQGTSKNPCSEVYPGSQAFSEPESKALSDFVNLSSAKFKLYATYHSYGEYILYPWGYDKVVPEDYKDLDRVGNDAAQAIINKGGPMYKVGASSLVLYPASGGSDDWAKAVARIKYTYTVELSDSGRFGFVLPAAYITKVAKESLAALRVMADAANRA